MRISKNEKKVILDSILSLDKDAEIFLYGSRASDFKKGGDIDLLIFSKKILPENKNHIRNLICDQIGEQKVDLLIAIDETSPFVRKAKKTGN
jgi:hypothetical protein